MGRTFAVQGRAKLFDCVLKRFALELEHAQRGGLIHMKIRILTAVVYFALSTLGAMAYSIGPNIVANGDFETITGGGSGFPPWQFSHGFGGFINEPGSVASGNNCVFIGGLAGGDMWQDLSTVVGDKYQFGFYERGDDPGQTERISVLNVYWNGLKLGSFTDDNKVPGWSYHLFTVTATATTTRIDFQQASSTIGWYGYPGVDAVSVNRVPETTPTIYLLGCSFVAFLGLRRFARVRGQKR